MRVFLSSLDHHHPVHRLVPRGVRFISPSTRRRLNVMVCPLRELIDGLYKSSGFYVETSPSSSSLSSGLRRTLEYGNATLSRSDPRSYSASNHPLRQLTRAFDAFIQDNMRHQRRTRSIRTAVALDVLPRATLPPCFLRLRRYRLSYWPIPATKSLN